MDYFGNFTVHELGELQSTSASLCFLKNNKIKKIVVDNGAVVVFFIIKCLCILVLDCCLKKEKNNCTFVTVSQVL